MIDWIINICKNNVVINIFTIVASLIAIAVFYIQIIHPKIFGPTKVKIEYSIDQSSISKLVSDRELINNKMCISFYSLKVIGLKEKATSIKDVSFFIKCSGKWIQGNYIKIKINYSEQDGANIPCVVMGNPNYKIVIMNWTEITEIYNKKIDYGEVLLGSAIYCFDLSEEEIFEATKMKFIVKDNFNREYVYKSKMDINVEGFEKGIYYLDFDIDLNQ